MEELIKEIKGKILEDVTAVEVLEFKQQDYSSEDIKSTKLFNRLLYAFERELSWDEKRTIDEIKRTLDNFEAGIRNVKKLMRSIFKLKKLGELRDQEESILTDVCFDIMK